MKIVTVERWKKSKYIVNAPTENGFLRPYIWNMPVGKKPFVARIPVEVYEWIVSNTKAFDNGELRLADLQEGEKEELISMMNDPEGYVQNAKTTEEITTMITKSKLPQLKKELALITEKSTIQQVKAVFEDVKSELVGSKIELMQTWLKENNLVEE